MYRKIFKSLLDKIASIFLIVLVFPLGIIIAVCNLAAGLPVFFYHERPGLNGQRFRLIKFCTIHPGDRSISGFGDFLRKSSLDELPQLINVLRGEMSIVGPRPLLIEYLDKFDARQKRRHDVRPGITGLAQVSGRNTLTLTEKVEFDLQYVESVSLGLDVTLVFKTFSQVFKIGEADGHRLESKNA